MNISEGRVLPVWVLAALCLLLLCASSASAADMGEADYWIGRYGRVEETHLVRRAHEVFSKVLAASDRKAGVTPAFYIIDYPGTPWAQTLADGSVMLSRNGLEFCYAGRTPEEGDARVAFVVGHELAHQFNGDLWHYRFLRTAEDAKEGAVAFQDIRDLATNPEMIMAQEIRADQYGIIYAVLAGFRSDAIVSEDVNFFLEWARNENPASTAHMKAAYEKREKAVAMRLGEVARRVPLFQLGVANYHIGRYEEALKLFERFAAYFPGREVYLNIGTIYLRQAYDRSVRARKPGSFPYALDFGIEVKTRARDIDVGIDINAEGGEDFEGLMEPALRNLEKSVEFDPRYAEGRNNLGCARILEGRYYDAIPALEKALESSPGSDRVKNNLAVAYILLGRELRSGVLLKKAEAMLREASSANRSSRENLSALERIMNGALRVPVAYADAQERTEISMLRPEVKLWLRPGATIEAGRQVRIEELSKVEGKSVSVFTEDGGNVFLLVRGKRVRMVMKKALSLPGIKLGGAGLHIPESGNWGVIATEDGKFDYFEF